MNRWADPAHAPPFCVRFRLWEVLSYAVWGEPLGNGSEDYAIRNVNNEKAKGWD
jgi:hypothetical protein